MGQETLYLSTLEDNLGQLSDPAARARGISKMINIQNQGIPNWRVLDQDWELCYNVIVGGYAWYFTDNIGNIYVMGMSASGSDSSAYRLLIQGGIFKMDYGNSNPNLNSYDKDKNWLIYRSKRDTGGGWMERDIDKLKRDLFPVITQIENSKKKYPTPLLILWEDVQVTTLNTYLPYLMIAAAVIIQVVPGLGQVAGGALAAASISLFAKGATTLISKWAEGNKATMAEIATVTKALSPVMQATTSKTQSGSAKASVGNTSGDYFSDDELDMLLDDDSLLNDIPDVSVDTLANCSDIGSNAYGSLLGDLLDGASSLVGLMRDYFPNHINATSEKNLGAIDYSAYLKLGIDALTNVKNTDVKGFSDSTGLPLNISEKIIHSAKQTDGVKKLANDYSVAPTSNVPDFNAKHESVPRVYLIDTYSAGFKKTGPSLSNNSAMNPNTTTLTRMIIEDPNPINPYEHKALVNNLQGLPYNPYDLDRMTIEAVSGEAKSQNAITGDYYIPTHLPPRMQVIAGKVARSRGYNVKSTVPQIDIALRFDKEFI